MAIDPDSIDPDQEGIIQGKIFHIAYSRALALLIEWIRDRRKISKINKINPLNTCTRNGYGECDSGRGPDRQ